MNHRMRKTGFAGLLLLALVLVVAAPSSAQDAAAVYKAKCVVCHSDDGSGSGATGKQLGAKDLRSDDVQKQTDAQLNDSITNGMGKKMAAYKEVASVVSTRNRCRLRSLRKQQEAL